LAASSAPISGSNEWYSSTPPPAGASAIAATFSLGSGFLKGSILAVHVLVDQERQPTGTSLGRYFGAEVEAAPSYYRKAFMAMAVEGAHVVQSNAKYL